MITGLHSPHILTTWHELPVNWLIICETTNLNNCLFGSTVFKPNAVSNLQIATGKIHIFTNTAVCSNC